jgi:hypothetical protein
MKVTFFQESTTMGLSMVLHALKEIPDSRDIPSRVESLVRDFSMEFDLPFKPLNLPKFPENINDLNLDEWVDRTSFSDKFKNLAKGTLGILERDLNIRESFNEFDRLLNQAKSTLSETEYLVFDDHIYVAKRSMEFWKLEIDGTKIWQLHASFIDSRPAKGPINMWKVFGYDCVGGFFGGPGGYIGASLISVIMQY